MSAINAQNIAQLIARWRNDPLAFVTEALGQDGRDGNHEAWLWQRQALTALRNELRIAIRSGHGVGKTAFLSWTILWFGLFRNSAKIGITAPVSDQLEINLWGELRRWRQALSERSAIGEWLAGNVDIKSDKVVFGNGSEAVARTARPDKPEALAGLHAKDLLFIVDEASGVDDIIFETAIGSLSTPGAIQILTGNPTRTHGYFFNAFHKDRANWWTRRVSSLEVPLAQGHIADVRDTWGEGSDQWRVRVEGNFPTGGVDQLITLDAVERSMGRDVQAINVRPLWGVDVGYKADRSALSKRKGNVMTEPPKYWVGMDTMQLAGLIYQEWHRTPIPEQPSEILVDSIGIGEGVVHRLQELGLPVRGINVAEAAIDASRFQRLRDEIWWKAREWFSANNARLPPDTGDPKDARVMRQLVSELTAPILEPPTSNGKIAIEQKSKTRTRIKVSPDLADSFILTFASFPIQEGRTQAFTIGRANTSFDPIDL